MKKYLLLMLIFASTALVFTGCFGSRDKDDDDDLVNTRCEQASDNFDDASEAFSANSNEETCQDMIDSYLVWLDRCTASSLYTEEYIESIRDIYENYDCSVFGN